MLSTRGRITLPAEAGMEEHIPFFARKWGIDAIRDSDGTRFSEEILRMGYRIYSTLCLIREDLDYAKAHLDELQAMYLLSKPVMTVEESVTIDLLTGYFREQFCIDPFHDPAQWWEVVDRTTGRIVSAERWSFDVRTGCLTIHSCRKWHRYTVSFLVRQIWEPVSMYNHLTNSWSTEHLMPLDPRHAGARRRLRETLEAWLASHPRTDVVRFTSFFYNFDLIYDASGKECQVDWFGYLSCVSPEAILEFQEQRGYLLRPEDFIDMGYYNSPFRVPSKRYLDWMAFQQRFVVDFARECVAQVHKAGKQAIMFLGDHWIGTEPYGPLFREIGLDGVVGSVGDGVTLRMIADVPTPLREGRLLPYFFPDTFHDGGDPASEFMKVWVKVRRALLHCSLQRIGFGGYLSLVRKFPRFVDQVEKACDEFRELWDKRGKAVSYKAPFKVAFLNAWGHLRTWQSYQITHSTWNQQTYSYLGLLEALSGMNVKVEFISFDDLLADGVPPDLGIIVNAGEAYTAWSGGNHWRDVRLLEIMREWVHGGGGFVGVGEPTACEHQGQFSLQLHKIWSLEKR